MPNGEDFLFKPVSRGYLRLEGLYDGTYSLEMVQKANDAIDVEDENTARIRAWEKASQQGA